MKKETAAKNFLKTAKGKVGILFDEDADGIASAALLLAFFKKKGIEAKAFAARLEKEYFHDFAKKEFDYYIVADLPVDQYLDFVKPLKGKHALFIDHHPITNDLNKHGFVHFNPRFSRPKAYICTAHNIFNLLGPSLKNFRWLMRIGAVGDREIEGTDKEAEATDTVNAVAAMKKKSAMESLARFLSACKNLEDFLSNKNYQKIKRGFDKEIDRQIAKYELEATGEITFFQVKSRYRITAVLSSKLFDLYPHRTIVLYRKRPEGMWSVSGRSKKHNIGKAFGKASEGIGKGGGHPVAAGAHVNDFKEFKKRLLEILE